MPRGSAWSAAEQPSLRAEGGQSCKRLDVLHLSQKPTPVARPVRLCALPAPPYASIPYAAVANKKRMNGIWRYWGLIAFVVAMTGWLTADFGPLAITALSALSFLWFLFQAPVPCAALNRGEAQTCRNNGRGVLRGCHIKQHQWQKLKGLVVRRRWREISADLFPNATTSLASLGAIVALLSSIIGVAKSLTGKG